MARADEDDASRNHGWDQSLQNAMMAGRPDHGSSRGPKPTFDYVFSNWDRRCGIDRRRGKRRLRAQPVLFDLRLVTDRRQREKRTVMGPILPQPVGRYRAVVAILGPALLHRSATIPVRDLDRQKRDPSPYLVTVREGLAGSVYAGWERTVRKPDGSVYRRMAGAVYRRIGSALLPLEELDDVDRADVEYERENQRAYQIIYGQHPELRGRGEQRLGEIIVSFSDLET